MNTSEQREPLPPRRGRWAIFLPTLIMLALAAAWSGFWFVAAGRAEGAVDEWLRREAAKGRVYECADKRYAGYPFRVELICEGPTARLPGDGGPIVASAARFVALAQVYDPKRLIGELSGPLAVTGPDGSRADLSFSLAQASMAIEGNRLQRSSVSLTAPRLVVDGAEIGFAEGFQLHLRRAPGGRADAYDLAARLDKGTSPLLDLVPVGSGPVSLELQAEARGLDDLQPRPTSERLKAFAAAGGVLHVALARIARGSVVAEAKGEGGLDQEGRVNGAFEMTARGIEGLVAGLVDGGRRSVLSSLMGAGASLLGKPAKLDGQPAVAYPVSINEGKVMIGPVRVWRAPPLF
jgi:hypothetical protein